VATVLAVFATKRSILRPSRDALPVISPAIPALSSIPTLLLCVGCCHSRSVGADPSTVTTSYRSPSANTCRSALAISCRQSATARDQSPPAGSRSATTSRRKKVTIQKRCREPFRSPDCVKTH
jgi:hypothetical protein